MGKGSIGWCEGVGRDGRVEKQQNPCAARVSEEAQTSRRPFVTECLLPRFLGSRAAEAGRESR